MKVAVVYRSKSDHERAVLEFEHEFKHRTGRNLDMQDVSTRDGASMASLYGIVSYPTVLALADDGRLMQQWPGSIPLLNEVQYYTSVARGVTR
jgi:hypothetical protein